MASPDEKMHIVIVGGGIIGCTAAYYITRHASYKKSSITLTLLEASSIAAGASGKAGGLVAKWAYPKDFAKVSYSEHERLAQEYDGASRWGWRYVNCGQWEGRGRVEQAAGAGKAKEATEHKGKHTKQILPKDLDWVEGELTQEYSPMAGPGETAQVHPYFFTKSMCELAEEEGLRVILGKVTTLKYSTTEEGSSAIAGVEYRDSDGVTQTLPASTVIVAAGPWTPKVVPPAPITATRAHSITIRTSKTVSPYALFTEIELPPYAEVHPEVYARPNNEVYSCGPTDDEPLPATAAAVEVKMSSCDDIFKQVSSISPDIRDGEVTTKQACYLPHSDTGSPVIGNVPNVRGLIVAAGHTCWGICNATGTGKALSELVLDGKVTCAKIDQLQPAFRVSVA